MAYLSGVLDRLTNVRWEDCRKVDGKAASRPYQTPVARCDEYDNDTEGMSLVCHLKSITLFLTELKWPSLRFDREAEEAEQFIGEPTRDLEDVRVYITRKWWITYIHSNYIKPQMNYPTKMITTAPLRAYTIFTNLVFWERPEGRSAEQAMTLHRDRVQYFVNERKFPKGNAAFYCGATNVRFVSVGSSWRSWLPF